MGYEHGAKAPLGSLRFEDGLFRKPWRISNYNNPIAHTFTGFPRMTGRQDDASTSYFLLPTSYLSLMDKQSTMIDVEYEKKRKSKNIF